VTVELRLAKATALLAYLTVTCQSQSRDALATLLWPESDTHHARTSLRSILLEINNTLGRDWLDTDRTTVRCAQDAAIWVDVAQFQDYVGACRNHGHLENDVCPLCIPLLSKAVDLYQGDFMAGFSLRDSSAFDEWQFFQTERLRSAQANALARLARAYSTDGRQTLDLAIGYARRWVAHDPVSEPAHRQLMQLYLKGGRRTEALRQYQTCAQILQQELGIGPSEPTLALAHHIQLGQRSPRKPLAAYDRPRPADPVTLSASHAPLPAPLTPFLGREVERAEIVPLLRDNDECRLVSLVGPGGVGKTRLAIQLAEDVSTDFLDGVAFVSLDSVDLAEFFQPTLADALHIPYRHGGSLVDKLCEYLGPKSMLLVVDNFDRHVGRADLLATLLEAAPSVKILVTSQEPLNVQGEWLINISGLAYPETTTQADEAEAYSAVQLFLQAARRLKPNVDLADDEWPWIIRICQLVDGMPLGIELAASWVRMLSYKEIVRKIESNLEFLTTSLRNVPERHRSMRAVFEHAWQLLSAEEQRAFRQMSVFVGGFQQEAAEWVADVSLRTLRALANRGLLRRHASGRYDRHPLLWLYAAEKLAADPEEEYATHKRHCTYYTAFLQKQLTYLVEDRGKAALEAIAVEIENVRTAWHWAMTHCQEANITQALEQLYDLYETRAWQQAKGTSAQKEPIADLWMRGQQTSVSNRARLYATASPDPSNQAEALKTLVLALLAEV
jgi:predicted ATPase/DNA-binding SARP family transcriptional activator